MYLRKNTALKKLNKIVTTVVLTAFVFTGILPSPGQAQTILNLPVPGAMVPLSPGFTPPIIRGLTIHTDNPFEFDGLTISQNIGIGMIVLGMILMAIFRKMKARPVNI